MQISLVKIFQQKICFSIFKNVTKFWGGECSDFMNVAEEVLVFQSDPQE